MRARKIVCLKKFVDVAPVTEHEKLGRIEALLRSVLTGLRTSELEVLAEEKITVGLLSEASRADCVRKLGP